MAKKKLENTEFDWRSIKTPEAAFEKAGYPPFKKLTDPMIPEKFRDAFSSALILAIAFEAVNEDWKADLSDPNQKRYWPWGWISSRGLDFSDSSYYFDGSSACVGFPLCTNTPEKALHIFHHFNVYWKAWLLNVIPE